MPIMDNLKQKAGPLPVYAWAVLIVGAIFAYSWYRNKQSASSQDSQDTGNGDTTDSSSGNSGDFDAAEAQALYTLNNQLGLVTSEEANLGTNIGRNTRVVERNTKAVRADTKADKEEGTHKGHKPIHKRKHPIRRPHKPVRNRTADTGMVAY